jgi:hypothetical protein
VAAQIASWNSLRRGLAAQSHNHIGGSWNTFQRIVYLRAEARWFSIRDRITTLRKQFRNSGSFSHPEDLPESLRKKTAQSRD